MKRWLAGSVVLALGVLLAHSIQAQDEEKLGEKGTKKFELQEDTDLVFHIKLPKGKKIFIKVESEKDGDVDLFVDDADGNEVAADERENKNCIVAFTPEKEQEFKITVHNLGPGVNKGTITWAPDMFKLTELKPFDIKEDETKVFEFEFKKGVPAAVFIDSEKDADVDLFIKNKDGNQVEFDDSPSKNCAVTWTPEYTGTFRILVTNL